MFNIAANIIFKAYQFTRCNSDTNQPDKDNSVLYTLKLIIILKLQRKLFIALSAVRFASPPRLVGILPDGKWWALPLIIQLTLSLSMSSEASRSFPCFNQRTTWSRRRCCTYCCCPRAPYRRPAWCKSRPRARGVGQHCCWRNRSSGRRLGQWHWLSPGGQMRHFS